MKIFSIKGKLTSQKINSFNHLKIQALDDDQKWTEDRNDDLLGAAWANSDGSFEINFDNSFFGDNFLEGKPEIYFIIRDKNGQIIHETDHITMKYKEKDRNTPIVIPVEINIDLPTKHRSEESSIDPYKDNNERIMSAFSSLGDLSILNNNEDFERNFRLLNNSIAGWLFYAQEYSWNKVGYDGPQVPRYPHKEKKHKHVLEWEQEKK